MEETEIQVLYDVTDASWRAHDRIICDIILSDNHITKTVFDIARQRFISLYAAKATLENSIAYTRVLDSIAGIEIATDKRWFLSSPKTVIVPEALYDDSMSRELISHHQKIDEDDTVRASIVKRLDARLIFAHNNKYNELVKNPGLGIGSFISADAPWLDTLYMSHKNSTGLTAHINISDGFFSIAVFKDAGLQFYNTFNFDTSEELLYFIMFVSEQLHISPLRDPYFYSGFIKKGDPAYELLARYIKNLNPEERPAQYNYCMPMLEIPGHMFFNNLCTPVCE